MLVGCFLFVLILTAKCVSVFKVDPAPSPLSSSPSHLPLVSLRGPAFSIMGTSSAGPACASWNAVLDWFVHDVESKDPFCLQHGLYDSPP